MRFRPPGSHDPEQNVRPAGGVWVQKVGFWHRKVHPNAGSTGGGGRNARIAHAGPGYHEHPVEKGALMAFPGDRTFLIGPFLDWWDRHVARRDAKRTKSREEARGTSAQS